MTTVTDAGKQLIANDPAMQSIGEVFSEVIAAIEARARLEGMGIMREAVEDAIRHATPLDDSAVSWGDGWADTRLAVRNLDPTAILAAHTRAKAMDELIAGDADIYTTPPVG